METLSMTHTQERSSGSHADIAIVGMACMFPHSPDLRRYWENIMRRVDCIREIPQERWDSDRFFDEDRFARDKVYSKWGGFLESIRFDPMKWKIPPASLLSIDPIQLLSLEVASQAFEDAGYDQKEFPRERTGVIFACAGSHDVGGDYAFRTMLQHYLPRVKDLSPELQQKITDDINATLPEWSEDSFPGFLMNVIAGRIANRFDLGGPNYVVDAACAASLAALHAAIGQLRLGTVDAMLVGASDGTNNPFCYMSFAKTHALSPRGRSRPFDNSADGIALGEGIASVMIRRLADAERDGDKIYAVIKGIGASSDGRNRSMTAPHPPGQILAMKRAYEDAGVPAATISLVEAHGTGTAVGDSTEITSLHTLFSEATKDEQYAAVGSVKSQIGHTKTCAGLASLVKTTLALKHRVLPPTINVETPNENVDFRHSPFYINTETRPWFEELSEHPRRAGVSAFGFGGTNFHVVMEEYTRPGPSQFDLDLTPRAAEVLLWQRANRSELVADLRKLQAELPQTGTIDLAQLARSLRLDESQRAEASTACRLAIVASTVDELRAKLAKAIDQLGSKSELQDPTGIYYSEAAPVAAKTVAFLYPGQGSQSVNMLRDLAVLSQWAHGLFTTANRELSEFFPIALTRMIFPPPAFSPEEEEDRKQRLNDTRVAQPALGLMEWFATELLKRHGVTPGGVAGHSYGEYVALAVAGAMSPEDLLTVSAHRGKVSAAAGETCPGAMAAVQAGAEETRKAIADLKIDVHLANLNAPDQTVIAGAEDAVVNAVAQLNARGLKAKRIPVTAAFHTPLLATAAQPLSVVLKHTQFHKPTLPVYSNTLADRYPADVAKTRELLQRHILEPVRFEDEIRKMRADGYEVFLEVGPGRVLSGLVGRILADKPAKVLSLDAGGRDGVTQLAHLLSQLVVLGLPVDLEPWFTDRGLKTVGAADYLAEVVATAQPKKSDWILSVHGAKPVTPLPVRKGKPGDGLRAKFGGKNATVVAQNGAATHETAVPVNGAASATDTNHRSGTNGKAATAVATAATASQTAQATAVNRVATASSPQPAPAPAPLPPPGRVRGTGVAETNGHGPGKNGSASRPAVAPAATNGQTPVHTAAPAARMDSAIVVPGSNAGLAPCLPLVSDPHLFANGVSPQLSPTSVTRFAVSTTPAPQCDSGMNPAAAQMILQSQALMMQMLDLQKWQQQVALRFVESHQQLVQSCASGVALPVGLPMMAAALPQPAQSTEVALPAAVAAPVPQGVMPAPTPAPVAAAPMPAPALAVAKPAPVAMAVAPKPVSVAAPSRPVVNRINPTPVSRPEPTVAQMNGNGKNGSHPVVPQPHVAVVAKVTPAPVATPAGDDAIPTPDEFKIDLLDAVSERTGYPIEMLDLDLAMEAGLGIDSIKTVEIFSNLKKYHPFFQQDDQDEEEALKEFTKLKTLGDIISAYELRYQAVTSTGPAPKIAQNPDAAVERYSLEAVEAPTSNEQKKTTLASS
jgi:polyketide-type polyunsaturated fatty acid synthase PfaA